MAIGRPLVPAQVPHISPPTNAQSQGFLGGAAGAASDMADVYISEESKTRQAAVVDYYKQQAEGRKEDRDIRSEGREIEDWKTKMDYARQHQQSIYGSPWGRGRGGGGGSPGGDFGTLRQAMFMQITKSDPMISPEDAYVKATQMAALSLGVSPPGEVDTGGAEDEDNGFGFWNTAGRVVGGLLGGAETSPAGEVPAEPLTIQDQMPGQAIKRNLMNRFGRMQNEPDYSGNEEDIRWMNGP